MEKVDAFCHLLLKVIKIQTLQGSEH